MLSVFPLLISPICPLPPPQKKKIVFDSMNPSDIQATFNGGGGEGVNDLDLECGRNRCVILHINRTLPA